jgi:hypothetical protein
MLVAHFFFTVFASLCLQIAGGYYGDANKAADSKAVAPADNKGKGWPIRLLTAYIVRPGEC